MFKKWLLFAVLFTLLSLQAYATETSWLPVAGNSDWSNAANWTNGVPDQYTNATIVASNYSPKVNIEAVCLNLTITSGTLFMRVLAETPHSLHIYGNLVIAPQSPVAATGPCIFNMGDATTTVDGYVDVDASTSFPGTLFDGSLAGTINIAGNLNLNTNGIFNCGQSTVNFFGTGPSTIPPGQSFWNLQVTKTTIAGIASLTPTPGVTTIANQLILTTGIFNAGSARVEFTGSNAFPFVVIAGAIFNCGTSTFAFKTTTSATVASQTYYDIEINRPTYVYTSDVGTLTTLRDFNDIAGSFIAGGNLIIGRDINISLGASFSGDGGTHFTHNVTRDLNSAGTFHGGQSTWNVHGKVNNTNAGFGSFIATSDFMNIWGDFLNPTTNAFYHFNGTMDFKGTVHQNIAGVTYNTLMINNASPSTCLLTSNATVTTMYIGNEVVNAIFDDGGYLLLSSPASTSTLICYDGVYKVGSPSGPPAFTSAAIAPGFTFDY